jgi:hypothetical protein
LNFQQLSVLNVVLVLVLLVVLVQHTEYSGSSDCSDQYSPIGAGQLVLVLLVLVV